MILTKKKPQLLQEKPHFSTRKTLKPYHKNPFFTKKPRKAPPTSHPKKKPLPDKKNLSKKTHAPPKHLAVIAKPPNEDSHKKNTILAKKKRFSLQTKKPNLAQKPPVFYQKKTRFFTRRKKDPKNPPFITQKPLNGYQKSFGTTQTFERPCHTLHPYLHHKHKASKRSKNVHIDQTH